MKSPLLPSGGFRKMFSFGYACLVYHATSTFCKRFFPWKADPLGKTSGQMVGAARSARQNIVEASSRAGTSKETELKLLDVAKGSLAELQGDYEAFLTDANETVWSKNDPRRREVAALDLDGFALTDDVLHDFSVYILRMRARFAPWLENEDPVVAANSVIVAIERAKALRPVQPAAVLPRLRATHGQAPRPLRARPGQGVLGGARLSGLQGHTGGPEMRTSDSGLQTSRLAALPRPTSGVRSFRLFPLVTFSPPPCNP